MTVFVPELAMNGWSLAQELRNNHNLPQVHKRRRVADFGKFDQFRARPAPDRMSRLIALTPS